MSPRHSGTGWAMPSRLRSPAAHRSRRSQIPIPARDGRWRAHRAGSVSVGPLVLDVGAAGFPAATDLELLVEGGGILQGRFLMTPVTGERSTLEQRLLAVALADQVGAALATSHPVDQS